MSRAWPSLVLLLILSGCTSFPSSPPATTPALTLSPVDDIALPTLSPSLATARSSTTPAPTTSVTDALFVDGDFQWGLVDHACSIGRLTQCTANVTLLASGQDKLVKALVGVTSAGTYPAGFDRVTFASVQGGHVVTAWALQNPSLTQLTLTPAETANGPVILRLTLDGTSLARVPDVGPLIIRTARPADVPAIISRNNFTFNVTNLATEQASRVAGLHWGVGPSATTFGSDRFESRDANVTSIEGQHDAFLNWAEKSIGREGQPQEAKLIFRDGNGKGILKVTFVDAKAITTEVSTGSATLAPVERVTYLRAASIQLGLPVTTVSV